MLQINARVGIFTNADARNRNILTSGRITRMWRNGVYASVLTDDGRLFVRCLDNITDQSESEVNL